jgi:hypothetical protein
MLLVSKSLPQGGPLRVWGRGGGQTLWMTIEGMGCQTFTRTDGILPAALYSRPEMGWIVGYFLGWQYLLIS